MSVLSHGDTINSWVPRVRSPRYQVGFIDGSARTQALEAPHGCRRLTVNGRSSAQLGRARLLLAREGAAGSADECATAAGRVYDKLHAHLDPLVGSAGVQALLVRSMKLTHGEFPFLQVAVLEGSPELRECLRAQEPAVAMESATALFGTFFALITTFIGERLTMQVLRSAWPMIEETAPTRDTIQ